MDAFGKESVDLARVPAPRLGQLLITARENAGMDIDAVAAGAGVGPRRLRRWERGDAAPNADELERIAQVLGTTASQLLPQRDPVRFDAAAHIVTVAGRSEHIDPASGGDGNEAVLKAYLSLVREVRGIGSLRRLHLRHDDIEVLAELLDLNDADLDARLARLLGLEVGAAREVRGRIARQRLRIAAASAAMGLMAVVPFARASAHESTSTEQKPVEIGSALSIDRAQQPADPTVRLGDVYHYER